MIIEADENGIKKSLVEHHYILAYEGLEIITIQFNDNALTATIHNLEVFENGRDLADRVLELGLNFKIEHILIAKEFDVECRPEIEAYFLSVIWTEGTEQEQERAIKLGYERPSINE